MNKSLHDKVRSGIIWSAIQNWGMRLSSLLLFMVIARLLSAEQLGLFAAATVVIGFFNMLSEQGLGEAVVQREHISPEQMNAVFWLNLCSATLIVVIVWFAAPHIAAMMKLNELTQILRVSSLTLPITASSFGQISMRKRNFSYKWIATTNLISTVVGIGVVLALVFAGFGVWGLVAQSLVATSIVAGLLWIRPAWKLTRHADFRGIRPLMSYGSIRLGTNLLEFANTRYIEIFLVSTLGPIALATYTVGLKLHQAMIQMLSSMILDVAHSGFSRLANDRPALINAYYKSITLTATVAVPAFFMVASIAPSLTIFLFSDKWVESSEVMRWMAILGAVQVLQFYNGTVYNAIGRPSIGLKFLIAKVFLTFGALAAFGDGGMTHLLYAYISSQLITTPASFYLVRRLIGLSLSEIWHRIWPMLACSAALIAAAISTQELLLNYNQPIPIVLLGSISAGAFLYVACLYIFAPRVFFETFNFIRPKI